MNAEIFVEIFLPKSKPLLLGKSICVERAFSDSNAMKSQKYYSLGAVEVNLQPKDKESFRNKFENIVNRKMPYITRKYLELCFFHSLKQVIIRPTRLIDQTSTLIDYMLT